MGTVYLIHFTPPYKHARHYLGYTAAADATARLKAHQDGYAANLTAVVQIHGCRLVLVRTWSGNRNLERRFKRWHGSVRLCPICNPKKEKPNVPNRNRHPVTVAGKDSRSS